ncbi:MAG: hypothetical protein E6772_07920 [Dysgonomonas sp.]|nr:hypothetical protein [Dysgonomonas sp.]
MKTKYYLLFAAIALLCFSCQNDRIDDLSSFNETTQSDKDIPIVMVSPALGILSESNPTLYDDWENLSTVYLNDGRSINAPWNYGVEYAPDFPENYGTDIKKEDGWAMLTHTMRDLNSAAPNYILLYNKNRGLLKVFYFNTDAVLNNSLVWSVEANNPTSILPRNTLIQELFNSTNKYATTSNIINESSSNFGQLNMGWNMFTLELPYGETANNPILAIRAYNKHTTSIQLGGTFAGEVTVKIPKDSDSPMSSLMSALGKIPGVKNIPAFSAVKEATSFLGKFGNSSLFKSKKDTMVVKGTTSGKIELTGTSFDEFGGAVFALPNINIKALNNNEPLGLWALRETPDFLYNRYSLTSSSSDGYYSALIELMCDRLKQSVVVNPAVQDLIKSYGVRVDLFMTRNPSPDYENTQFADDYYGLKSWVLTTINKTGHTYHYPGEGPYSLILVLDHILSDDLYATFTVDFIYHDGSTFTSTRNYKINTTPYDNWYDIENKVRPYDRYEIIY